MNEPAPIPLNDLKRRFDAMRESTSTAASRVIKSGWYLLGPETETFEKEFAAYCGQPYCVTVASGTDALELAMRACGVGPDTEVITAPNAGMYSTTAALACGATVVFADIDPRNMLLSSSAVAEAIGPKTVAVVATHLYGQAADIAELRSAIGDSAVLIEDCAQAHGARLHGKPVGGLGDVAAFSFYPTKNLGALGDAGAVVTANVDVADRVRLLRMYGWTAQYHADLPGGRNSRMDELQAAVLRSRIPFLDAQNERRRAIVRHYRQAIKESRLLLLPVEEEGNVAHLCVARHPRRDLLRKRLLECGVRTGIHYPILDFSQKALVGAAWRKTSTLVAEECAEDIFTLPNFPELTDTEVERVAEALLAALKDADECTP